MDRILPTTFTLLGFLGHAGAVMVLDPTTRDGELDRIDVKFREEIEGRGVWRRGRPYLN